MTEKRIMKCRKTRKLSARNKTNKKKHHIHNLKEHSSFLKSHTDINSSCVNAFPLPTAPALLTAAASSWCKTHLATETWGQKQEGTRPESGSRAWENHPPQEPILPGSETMQHRKNPLIGFKINYGNAQNSMLSEGQSEPGDESRFIFTGAFL